MAKFRTKVLLITLGTASIALSVLWRDQVLARTTPSAAANVQPAAIAGAGYVEPGSEELLVGAEVSGKLRSLFVREGSSVRAGAVIAILENGSHVAEVQTAQAQVLQRDAELRRVENGARPQERRAAAAELAAAEAVLANALAERDRRRALLIKGAISREEAERAERESQVAGARREAASEQLSLLDDASREEDRARSAAILDIARGQLAQSRASLDKTFVKAPISGIVLRKFHNAGESVSSSPEDPIVSIGNINRLRIRTEVDESDVAPLRLGQRAYISADAFGNQKFSGIVTQIGQELGKKKVWKDEPVERADSHVLEVMIDLDPNQRLPLRLRVDVSIQTGEDSHANH